MTEIIKQGTLHLTPLKVSDGLLSRECKTLTTFHVSGSGGVGRGVRCYFQLVSVAKLWGARSEAMKSRGIHRLVTRSSGCSEMGSGGAGEKADAAAR